MTNDETLTALGELRARVNMLMQRVPLPHGAGAIEQAHKILMDLGAIDRRIIPLAVRLTTTGTATGQRMAAGALSDAFNVHTEGDFDYVNVLHSLLIRSWSCGNIIEEAGLTTRRKPSVEHMAFASQIMSMYRATPDFAFKEEERYWRGMAALVSVLNPEDDEDLMIEEGSDFIVWASVHPDIEAVVRLGRERETIDPSMIDTLIAGQARVAGSLKDGVL